MSWHRAPDQRRDFALLESLTTPLAWCDGELRVGWINPALGELIGARSVIGHDLSDLLLDGETLRHLGWRALTTRQVQRMRGLNLVYSAQLSITGEVSVCPLHTGQGVLIELQHRGETAAHDGGEAELDAAARLLARTLAHELRNPLAGLRGAAQLLKRELADPEQRACLDVIVQEADRLAALADRLLETKEVRRREPVNIHVITEHVRRIAAAEQRGLAIARDYDPSLPELHGDRERLIQAVLNLVRNAIEADARQIVLRTRAERRCRIGARSVRLAIRLDVQDDGRGVPQALAERIFLPLVSGRERGSGLGLSLALSVALEHQGSLTYRSEPGRTVFTLLLPYLDPEPVSTTAGAEGSLPAGIGPPARLDAGATATVASGAVRA